MIITLTNGVDTVCKGYFYRNLRKNDLPDIERGKLLTEVLDEFNGAGIRTSVLVAPDAEMIEYAAKAGADRVELYTEPYATAYPKDPAAAVAPFVEAAKAARRLGIGLNAGHDLSLLNLNYFYKNIPWLDEVSIGHALISDALYLGLERTIQEYKNCLR